MMLRMLLFLLHLPSLEATWREVENCNFNYFSARAAGEGRGGVGGGREGEKKETRGQAGEFGGRTRPGSRCCCRRGPTAARAGPCPTPRPAGVRAASLGRTPPRREPQRLEDLLVRAARAASPRPRHALVASSHVPVTSPSHPVTPRHVPGR